jgi:hypothetical protein
LLRASESLPAEAVGGNGAVEPRRHRIAARLVVAALTTLVMRDRSTDRDKRRTLQTETLIRRIVRQEPKTFSWLFEASARERSVFTELVHQLGQHIDYESLDPAILSHVYEQSLVDDDDRRQLGIHYTPPLLATRLLQELPVETVAPEHRHVLDPCCGSGTLLVAAHDRLRSLQPPNMQEDERHRELAVHLRGYDRDPFAAEIARLTLLLHAQPAGNGWQIEELDTLEQPAPLVQPKLIVTNPPWRFASDEQRTQTADDFLSWCMSALAPGGLLGVLLPGSWLSADHVAATRDRLRDEFDVFETWRLPEGTFATSKVSPAVIFARKRDGLGGRGARAAREIRRHDLQAFLTGAGASGSYLTPDDVPLSDMVPQPRPRVAVVKLDQVADILSGPQPLPSIKDRGAGTWYLNGLGKAPPYGVLSEELLWKVHYPEDFQGGRGSTIVGKKKVLASAARWANNPWRFRVAIDLQGVAMRNSVRGIAPRDQTDEDMLYAIAVIVGSGFASMFAASYGGDRNIPAKVLKSLPVPTDRTAIKKLARVGRAAADRTHDPVALRACLLSGEVIVWDAYGVSDGDRAAAAARFAGERAPDGGVRYPGTALAVPGLTDPFRRVGVVLDVEGNNLRLWVNGLTSDDGAVVPFPRLMPGWMAREGATFDVVGVDTPDALEMGRFGFQAMAWEDLDIENEDPKPVSVR